MSGDCVGQCCTNVGVDESGKKLGETFREVAIGNNDRVDAFVHHYLFGVVLFCSFFGKPGLAGMLLVTLLTFLLELHQIWALLTALAHPPDFLRVCTAFLL